MDISLTEIGIYLLGGAFLILLIMYILKTRIDNQFRKKMVPLLKQQKKTIDNLEKERDQLSHRATELKRDLNIQKNQQAIQDTEYEKINFILTRGIFEKLGENPETDIEKKNEQKTLVTDDRVFIQQARAIENWFQFKYLKTIPDERELEITEYLHKLADNLNKEYKHKKLNFICHLGEPIQVRITLEVFEFVTLTFGRLIGERSVSGNTLYFDTDKTGKKCLISLEDSGPGDHDPAIKSLFSDTWAINRLPELPDPTLIPGLVAKDLLSVFDGNAWYSRIHEIGIKITYSIPILIK
jgi:hypothetical protein